MRMQGNMMSGFIEKAHEVVEALEEAMKVSMAAFLTLLILRLVGQFVGGW